MVLQDDLNIAASKINDGYTFVINPLNTFVNPVSIPIPTINVFPLFLDFSLGDITLTLPQSLLLYFVYTGTLTTNWRTTFPVTGVWTIDASQVVFDGYHLNMRMGSSSPAQITSPGVYIVSIPNSNLVNIK